MQKLLRQFYQTSVTGCELKGDKDFTFPPRFSLATRQYQWNISGVRWKMLCHRQGGFTWCHVGCVYNATCKTTWIHHNSEIFHLHCPIYLNVELLSVLEDIGSFSWQVFQFFLWLCSQTYTQQKGRESSYLVIFANCHGCTPAGRVCFGISGFRKDSAVQRA